MSNPISTSPKASRIACPCCGYATLDERGGWEICRVCRWEDDVQDNHNATVIAGGPNFNASLARARLNFFRYGIFHPARDDLRENQDSVDGFPQLRTFAYETTDDALYETTSDWHVTVAQFDDSAESSFFSIGDAVRYRRRYLNSTTLDGSVDTVAWDGKMMQWKHRLLDAKSRPVGKTFTAADLKHKTNPDGG